MRRRRFFAVALVVALVLPAGVVGAEDPVDTLYPSNVEFNDQFGRSLSVSGDSMAVGAANGVAIYVLTDGAWVEQAFLDQDDLPPDSPLLGAKVAIDGDRLAVGNNAADEKRGAVVVFARDAGIWSHQETLVAPTREIEDHFGFDVALDGDTLVIGAPGVDYPEGSGAAHVYAWDGAVWGHAALLEGSLTVTTRSFGSTVDVDGATIVVGASQGWSADPSVDDGEVHVFVEVAGVWSVQEVLLAPVGQEEFGTAVAIDGDWMVVGVRQRKLSGWSSSGSALAYRRIAGSWSLVGDLQTGAVTSRSEYGRTVSILGDRIAVGSKKGVHVFGRNDSTFGLERDLLLENVPFWHVGVALFGTHGVLLSDMSDDTLGTNSGVVFVFDLTPECDGVEATIIGTSGPDTIIGTDGDDVIDARGGDDRIDGGGGNDLICGGYGNDSFLGGHGSDTFNGGDGTDTADYGGSPRSINADLLAGTVHHGAETDTLTGVENLNGSRKSDRIAGDHDVNVIRGGMGNDTINGRKADDVLIGGKGTDTIDYSDSNASVSVSLRRKRSIGRNDNDELYAFENVVGSPFNDVLSGNDAVNVIRGLGGNDLIIGTGGDDFLNGGTGRDEVSFLTLSTAVVIDLGSGVAIGSEGTDKLKRIEDARGGKANDVLLGSKASNRLFGSGGDDRLYGREGRDRLDGGGGNDYFEGGPGNDRFYGGGGFDHVSFANSPNPVTVNLEEQQATGEGSDYLEMISDITGSPYNDFIRGNSWENYLFGADGNDTIVAVHWHDVLAGGRGNDTLEGTNWTWVSYESAVQGVDVDLSTGQATGQGKDKLSRILSIIGSPHDDVLEGDGGDNTIIGLGGNDRFVGNRGEDLFMGGGGNDQFIGGSDWDSVTFENATSGVTVNLRTGRSTGAGNDTLSSIQGVVGSPFDDSLTGTTSNNTFVPLGGDDWVDGGGAPDDAVSFLGSPKRVVVDLIAESASGEGADTLRRIDNLVGTDKGDVLRGDHYGNFIHGMDGDDTIRGRGGSDVLYGGNGNDLLDGGAGTDRCIQGGGVSGQGMLISCESEHDIRTAFDLIVSSRWYSVYGGLRTWFLGSGE